MYRFSLVLLSLSCSTACDSPANRSVRSQIEIVLKGHRTTLGAPAGLPIGALGTADSRRRADVLTVAALAKRAYDVEPSAETMADYGVSALLVGDLERAVHVLNLCVASHPGRPGPLTDLSAAYLELATRSGRADLLPMALNAAARALALDPRSPQALFTWAQTLSQLRLPGLARSAAQAFSERDAQVAETLRGELKTTSQPSADDPRSLYARLESEFAKIMSEGTEEDERLRSLARAQQWAERLRAFRGDSYASDLLRAYREPAAPEAVAAGRQIAAIASSLAERDLGVAAEALRGLSRETLPTPLALQAEYHQLTLDFLLGRRALLYEGYSALAESARARRYLALEIQGSWMAILVHTNTRGSSAATIRRLGDLRALAAQGPPDLDARIASRIASTLWQLGAYREGWRTFTSTGAQGESLSELTALADSLDREGMTFAAADVLDAALNLHPRVRNATRVHAEMLAMRLRLALGNTERAGAHFAAARALLASLEGNPLRDALFSELALARLEGAPSWFQQDLFDDARSYLSRTGDRVRVPRLLLARARAHESSDPVAAAADMTEALRLLRRHGTLSRARGNDHDLREIREIVDEAIDVHVKGGDLDGLLDTLSVLDGPARSPATRRGSRTNDGAVVLEYVVWKNRAGVVVHRHGKKTLILLGHTREQLASLVARYHLTAEAPDQREALETLNRDLTNALLSPAQHLLVGADRAVILPDGPLWNVPFPSLFDPNTQTRLGSSWAITISATRLEPRAPPAGPVSSFLGIGYSPPSGPLEPLPSAEGEVRRAAAHYPTSKVLTGSVATRDAVSRSLRGFDVVHIAAHAYSSLTTSASAGVFLSPAGDDPEGGLVAYDDDLWNAFDRTQVVVLSTCVAARGYGRTRQAPPGLVSLLLSKGVRQIVASPLPLLDSSLAEPMSDLHARLREGVPPEEAVRAVFRKMGDGEFSRLSGLAVYR